MLEKDVMDVVVGAVEELARGGLLTVPSLQVTPVLFMEPGEKGVLHLADAHNHRLSVMERGRCHEPALDFVALGTAKIHIF